MTIEIIGVWSAFQSEKTGSTPVGSAMNWQGNLVQHCSFQLFVWPPIPTIVANPFSSTH
jgi:hypothetical protein